MKFSANLGFLWKDLPLPEAIRAAKRAGFDAVECHWPYETDKDEVKAALIETEFLMLSLNTRMGDQSNGEFGLTALPGREQQAQTAIDEALDYAAHLGTPFIHVMAGIANGPEAKESFVQNLTQGSEKAAKHEITLLIEPINSDDVPGYFLSSVEQAYDIICGINRPNLKMMFDCYHVAKMGHTVVETLTAVYDQIGHIQFASAPERGPPEIGLNPHGANDFDTIFNTIKALGYEAPLGAEYIPPAEAEHSLDWLHKAQML